MTSKKRSIWLTAATRLSYGKPLGPSGKNPFPTLIFLIDTFAELLTDSQVIAVHKYKITSNRMTLLSASTVDIDCMILYTGGGYLCRLICCMVRRW